MLLISYPDVPDSTGIVQQGRAHIVTTVPTSDGWGVFWLRDTTGDLFNVFLPSTLFYAHVGFDGRITAGPKALLDIHRHDREPLYMVTWRVDHFGLLVNELIGTDILNKVTYQYYYDVSIDGQLSARVGPIRYDLGPSGGIGEIVPYLDGFMVGVETACSSHQCDYAFKLGDHGLNKGRDLNVVEFDGTHSHAPNFAFDGTNVVVISSKDANNQNGGIVSQYISNSGTSITRSTPVIPNHGFLLDNNPDLAWNGSRFGAIWREVEGLTSPLDQNYRMRFATFTRTASVSTLLSDQFLEPSYVQAQYLGRSWGWTTNVSAVSDGWIASFAQGKTSGSPQAMIQHLAVDGTLKESWSPFSLDDYALHTSVHFIPAYKKTIGIATTHRVGARVDVTFSTLALACDP